MKTRALRALVRPTARAVPWVPLAVGAALGLAIVLVPAALTRKLTGTELADLMRIAATCLALGTAFLLDDPAARSTPSVPTPRLARNLIRLALAVPVLVPWWLGLLGLARIAAPRAATTHLPVAALSVEAGVLVAVALAVAALAQRRAFDGRPGTVAAPAVLVLTAAVWFLPRPLALVVDPRDPAWTAAHRRWVLLLAVAVVTFLWGGHETVHRGRRAAAASPPRGEVTGSRAVR